MSVDEDTPAETPMSKCLTHDSAQRQRRHLLLKLFEDIERRLEVIDRAQTYIIEHIEHVPDNTLSIVRAERIELASKTRMLIRQWSDTWNFDVDDERPSQTNITIENILDREHTRRASSMSTFGSAKFRRMVIMIAISVAGTIVGFVWALKALHFTSASWPMPSMGLRKDP
jgi:hypothetical protein